MKLKLLSMLIFLGAMQIPAHVSGMAAISSRPVSTVNSSICATLAGAALLTSCGFLAHSFMLHRQKNTNKEIAQDIKADIKLLGEYKKPIPPAKKAETASATDAIAGAGAPKATESKEDKECVEANKRIIDTFTEKITTTEGGFSQKEIHNFIKKLQHFDDTVKSSLAKATLEYHATTQKPLPAALSESASDKEKEKYQEALSRHQQHVAMCQSNLITAIQSMQSDLADSQEKIEKLPDTSKKSLICNVAGGSLLGVSAFAGIASILLYRPALSK